MTIKASQKIKTSDCDARCAYPVVPDRLVRIHDDRDALAGKKVDVLRWDGVMFGAVELHHVKGVFVDGERVKGEAGDGEDAEAVALALDNVYDRVGDGRATDVAAHAVDKTGVGGSTRCLALPVIQGVGK